MATTTGPRPEALQWGHALSGMDTARAETKEGQEQGLQWGHALSGMDTTVRLYFCAAAFKLQWGHALSGMDTIPSREKASTCRLSFNGAMPFQAWILLEN